MRIRTRNVLKVSAVVTGSGTYSPTPLQAGAGTLTPRVVVSGVGYYAPSARQNLALDSLGAVALASSIFDQGPGYDYAPVSAIKGDRTSLNYGHGGTWAAAGQPASAWLEIDLPFVATVDEFDVVTVPDNAESITLQSTFNHFGITDFKGEYWNGSAWTLIPGTQVSGNRNVWRQLKFSAITAQRFRLFITGSIDGYFRVSAFEIWPAAAAALQVALITTPAQQVTNPGNVVLTATASSPDARVAKVDFYDGTSATPIGTDTHLTPAAGQAGIYTFTHVAPAIGTHSYKAIATDNKTPTPGTATSNIVQVSSVAATLPESVQGTQVGPYPLNAGPIVDSAGNRWTQGPTQGPNPGNFQIFKNGALFTQRARDEGALNVDADAGCMGFLLYWGGRVTAFCTHGLTSAGQWWEVTANGWQTLFGDPREISVALTTTNTRTHQVYGTLRDAALDILPNDVLSLTPGVRGNPDAASFFRSVKVQSSLSPQHWEIVDGWAPPYWKGPIYIDSTLDGRVGSPAVFTLEDFKLRNTTPPLDDTNASVYLNTGAQFRGDFASHPIRLTLNNFVIDRQSFGLLTSNAGEGSTIIMNNGEFVNCGSGDERHHAFYIAGPCEVYLTDVLVHKTLIGHDGKSRAKKFVALRCGFLGDELNSSRQPELTEAGDVELRECVFTKGVLSDDPSTMVSYGRETWWSYGGYPTVLAIPRTGWTDRLTVADCLLINFSSSPMLNPAGGYIEFKHDINRVDALNYLPVAMSQGLLISTITQFEVPITQAMIDAIPASTMPFVFNCTGTTFVGLGAQYSHDFAQAKALATGGAWSGNSWTTDLTTVEQYIKSNGRRSWRKKVATQRPAPSLNGTFGGSVVDLNQDTWTLGPPHSIPGNFQTLREGVWVGGGGAIAYLFFNNLVYVKNAALAWYSWNGAAFRSESGDPRVNASTVTESDGTVWTFGDAIGANFKTLRNGVWVSGGEAVEYLLFNNRVYVKNSVAAWYSWNGSSWQTERGDPRIVIDPITPPTPINPAWRVGLPLRQFSSVGLSSRPSVATGMGPCWGAVCFSQNSQVAYDPIDHKMYSALIGGHASSDQNGIYAIDYRLDAPFWYEVLRASPYGCIDYAFQNFSYFPDNRPIGRHTYRSATVHHLTDGPCIFFADNMAVSYAWGSGGGAHVFQHATDMVHLSRIGISEPWEPPFSLPGAAHGGTYEQTAAVDPRTQFFYMWCWDGFITEFDPFAKTWRTVGSTNRSGQNPGSVIDILRDYFILADANVPGALTRFKITGGAQSLLTVTGPAAAFLDSGVLATAATCLMHDTRRDLYIFAGLLSDLYDIGEKIYRLFEIHPVTGASTLICDMNSHGPLYNDIAYDAALRGLVFCDNKFVTPMQFCPLEA